jgi:hypothetical protein
LARSAAVTVADKTFVASTHATQNVREPLVICCFDEARDTPLVATDDTRSFRADQARYDFFDEEKSTKLSAIA